MRIKLFGHYLGKFWRGNLSCELRRGRAPTCYSFTHYGEKRTFKIRFLYSLGVFIMDPLGRRWRHYLKQALVFNDGEVSFPAEQWLYHPLPGTRRAFLRFMRKHNMRFKHNFYKKNFPV